MAAAEQMKMNVENRLARVGAAIDDDAVAIFGDPVLLRETVCDHMDRADKLAILFVQVREHRDVLDRHDEDMHRSLGPDVPEGDDAVVAVDDVAFDLAFN